MRRISSIGLCGVLILGLEGATAGAAWAQRVSLVRDAEIEHNIRAYAAPLFAAAGLDTGAVSVHLVNDRGLNAFVAGGQRIFINTGLIAAAKDPNEIIGVIAHETGHIAGGHLARAHEGLKGASAASILSLVLGAAAAVGGRGDAASALILGGQQVAERSFLAYSRTQESAADQAAVKYLEATGQSVRGLHDFLATLGDQEALVASRQDPYVRSHPLTRDRITFLADQMVRASHSHKRSTEAQITTLQRMQAKIHGFLDSPQRVLRLYPENDASVAGRYARSAAYHRLAKTEEALSEVASLLAESPEDPWYHELKGQILYESGRVTEAIEPYRNAVRRVPENALLRLGLAQAEIASGNPAFLRDAVDNLEDAVRHDSDLPGAWKQLAVAYGRDGDLGQSSLASAEYNLRIGRRADAARFAERAERLLAAGSPGALRAQDIQRAAEPEKQR
jgi:predicted Zn-dependent protease